jgi:hypothetical protein
MNDEEYLSQRRMRSVKTVLTTVYEDLKMLEAGVWVPDADSVKATLDNLKLVANLLGIKLAVSQIVKDDIKIRQVDKKGSWSQRPDGTFTLTESDGSSFQVGEKVL